MTTKDTLALALEQSREQLEKHAKYAPHYQDPFPPPANDEARALEKVNEAIAALQTQKVHGPAFPLISLGQGLIEVGEGHQEGTHALIFGKNGTGQIGEPTQPERKHQPGETLAVVTFANVESLDVVADKLRVLRKRIAGVEQAKQPVDNDFLPMETAPTNGQMIRLLVDFEDNSLEDTSQPVWTIGANCFDNDGINEWKFAGWNWSHDCFTEGHGKPIGWLPMLEPAPKQAQDGMADAYTGAREDLAIWKRRALEAEELNRKFAREVNGPTFMGEPAPKQAEPVQPSSQKTLALALEGAELHDHNAPEYIVCAELIRLNKALSGATPPEAK